MHSHFEQDIIIEKYNRQSKAWEENVKREFIPEIRPFESSGVNWECRKPQVESGQIDAQKRLKNTLSSHLWLISRLSPNRK